MHSNLYLMQDKYFSGHKGVFICLCNRCVDENAVFFKQNLQRKLVSLALFKMTKTSPGSLIQQFSFTGDLTPILAFLLLTCRTGQFRPVPHTNMSAPPHMGGLPPERNKYWHFQSKRNTQMNVPPEGETLVYHAQPQVRLAVNLERSWNLTNSFLTNCPKLDV